MKYKPILFSSEMVQAILSGRKTQTRRIVKDKLTKPSVAMSSESKPIDVSGKSYWQPLEHCPYGRIGDIMWVRETHAKNEDNTYDYRADFPFTRPIGGWKPSIFMPFEACRIWLEITNIRVEFLTDISEQDAIAEGVELIKCFNSSTSKEVIRYRDYERPKDDPTSRLFHSATDSFCSLWNAINGSNSFYEDRKKWVWVIEFKRIEKK